VWKYVIVLVLCLSLFGCAQKIESYPKFRQGDIVKFKISDNVGMVIGSICWDGVCRYWVRVPVRTDTTNTNFIGNDDAISQSPLALIGSIEEFEIELYKGK